MLQAFHKLELGKLNISTYHFLNVVFKKGHTPKIDTFSSKLAFFWTVCVFGCRSIGIEQNLDVRDDVYHIKGDAYHMKDDVYNMKGDRDVYHMKDDARHMKGDVYHMKDDVYHMKGDAYHMKDDVYHMKGDGYHISFH